MSRPSKRHANVIRNRGLAGYDDDQLARFLGVTREVMNKWAKTSKEFALALEEARASARVFWLDIDHRVSERDQHERELAANAKRFAHLPHRQRGDDKLLAAAKAEHERAPNFAAGTRQSSTE